MPTDPSHPSAVDVALHQERVAFGIEQVATRAVVRRRVVTEVQQLQVEVRREVLEVEHVPLDGVDAAAPGARREPLVLVLSEEVPVLELRVRPYERVTLDVHSITEEQQVDATVGTEHAEVTTQGLRL